MPEEDRQFADADPKAFGAFAAKLVADVARLTALVELRRADLAIGEAMGPEDMQDVTKFRSARSRLEATEGELALTVGELGRAFTALVKPTTERAGDAALPKKG